MHYLIVFQILCGFFAAYVASRKARSPVLWWFAGTFLPVVGVVWALLVSDAVPGGAPRTGGRSGPGRSKRPKRCCGEFLPDCRGCPHFRRRLFRSEQDGDPGYCEFYEKTLSEGGSGRKKGEKTSEQRVSTGDDPR
jgi:hypothetical protein